MEPEQKKPILNDEQKNAAYCADNAVIAAGAGSGKTMVLASRFAWLVTEKKYHVGEILTLTFTRKAAAQMYRRIYLRLAEIARDDSGEKGALAKQALDEFTHARIQTLDSYCAAIVRQSANRYGIKPDFSINEDRCRRLAADIALPFLISRRDHHAIVRFYPHKSPMSIAKDIFAEALINYSHIDSPPRLEESIRDQCAIICREWKKQSEIICAKLHELVAVYSGNEKFHQDLAPILEPFAAGNITFPTEGLADWFNELIAIPHDSAIEWTENHPLYREIVNSFTFFSSICSLDMRKGSPQKNPAKEIVKELQALYREFSSVAVFCLQAGLIHSVLSLLSELQQDYLNRKRSEGVLTYNDVARLAKTILLEQPDIRRSEKESFRAIMIDEFQDNNELQKDLLFLLAEKPEVSHNAVPPAQDLTPGKLFFVGDEKQSIYRFRGADVSVFRSLQKELGGRELPLKTNYRSAPALIDAFNAIFGGSASGPAVFVPAADTTSLPPYEASFTPLRADKKSEGKLTLCILDKQDSEESEFDEENLSPVENEARFIAERINALLGEKDKTGSQKYQPHDIAILFRSRTPQHIFEKHLMLLNIPYASEDLNGFFYGGPVNDMMSVLRLAVYPKDRAAYAQMLRSPFAGLSLSGLTICLSLDDASSMDNAPSNDGGPFGDEPLDLLGEKDRAKYRHGQRIYQKISDSACTESICSLISELWYGEGYRYETEWNPKTAAYREMYDYLFHLAAQADEENQTLASFVDEIQNLDNAGERLSDIEIPLERPSAVHLITIHKSKGLEFPVVFLCCCDKSGRNDFSDDIFDTGTSGITVTPPLPPQYKYYKDIRRSYFWERSIAVEKAKRTAELRRLLYVGMTRAENELYLSGCLGISKELDLSGDLSSPDDLSSAFPRQLKQFIESKTEKAEGKNTIPGDTILEGNTFFGLCLPAFGNHIEQDATSSNDAVFTIEKIPAYNEQYMRNAEQHGSLFANDQKGLYSFFRKAEIFYKSKNTVETPLIPKKYFSPTSLLKAAADGILSDNFTVNREFSGDDAADIFSRVDTMLDRYAKQYGDDGEKFNSGSFGTIAHICAEAVLSGEEAVIPPKLAGFLTPADANAFLAAGNELAQRFILSPLGKIAHEAENRKSEFAFRSLFYVDGNEIFINGTIDLIFEDEQTVYVVDFKTDGTEFPEEHIPQMACYYRAASDLFAVPANKKCAVWLYYLRSGHAIDVTDQARDFKLEKRVGG
jgi:ATP-dependent helicase/nuclease subunit A